MKLKQLLITIILINIGLTARASSLTQPPADLQNGARRDWIARSYTAAPSEPNPQNLSSSTTTTSVSAALSLSLRQAFERALSNNHDVRLSTLAVHSAEANAQIANTSPNPSLTFQAANINPKQGIGSGSWPSKTIDSTIRLDQVFERGGKRRYRTENARELETAARQEQAESLRQLRISVSQAYYDLLAAQDKLRITQDTLGLFEASLQAAKKRKKAGDLSGADAVRLEVEALRARNDGRQALADQQKAKQALAYLLGIENQYDALQASDGWPAIERPDYEHLSAAQIDAWIEQRADVKAAQSHVAAALAARQTALALRKRDISVGMQFEHYPISAANNQGSGNSYGISAQVPLFINNTYQGEILAAEAALASAQENLEKTRSQARTDIQQSWESLQAASEQIERFQHDLLSLAERSAASAEFAFKNGAISVMDALDARRVYRSTQLDALTAQTTYAKALESWHAQIRPYSSEELSK